MFVMREYEEGGVPVDNAVTGASTLTCSGISSSSLPAEKALSASYAQVRKEEAQTESKHQNGGEAFNSRHVVLSEGQVEEDRGRWRQELEADYLFDVNLLKGLDFSMALSDYHCKISPLEPGRDLIMRPLRRSDFDKGYVELLTQLAVVGNITRTMFEARFDGMKQCVGTYYTIVLENTSSQRTVGAVTLVVEQKFIHSTALRGRVEDVVVHRDHRGQELGKLLVDTATILSRNLGCYKVSLECKDGLVNFYRQFGYKLDQGNNYMIQRFRE